LNENLSWDAALTNAIPEAIIMPYQHPQIQTVPKLTQTSTSFKDETE